MQILFLSQLLPYPLDAGPKSRSYYVLRHLAQRHTVTLVCFVRSSDPPWALEHMRQICQQVITVPLQRSRLRDGLALARSLATGRSFIIARDDSSAMYACLRRLLATQAFDAIHADQLWMAQYALYARQVGGGNFHPRLVLDQHNAVHLIPQRMAEDARQPLFRGFLLLEARRLARYEVQTCQQFDQVVWVTHQDCVAVSARQKENASGAELQPLAKIPETVIPICVDPDTFPLDQEIPLQPNLLFVGGMNWPPNADGMRWFVKEILPLVRAEIPDVSLCVVGKAPPEEILAVEGVRAPGYVEDLEANWSNSRVFVVPLRAGGGMRVKILDAWMHGLPVVSTSIGAEGIDFCDGENIAIADEPIEFARRIIHLLSREDEYIHLRQGGRVAVEALYNWKTVYQAWDKIYYAS